MNKYNIDFKNIDEVMKLLRGEYPLPIHSMEASEPLPTDTSQVMPDYVYSKKATKKFLKRL
ncbi:MAG: hypothetical protein ACI4JW_09955 [Oscillospiraceae bacterium]